MPPKNNRRKWAFRLLSILLGPLIFFGVIELVLLVFGFGYQTDFLITDSKDKNKWHDNKDFSNRFFPSQMTRTSQPILIPKQKPDKSYRIVIFGGSAAMGDPDPAFGPLRILEVMLKDAYQEKNFEFINTAVTAINSHVVREIASDLEKTDSDVWIIYMGNNEVYGPFGAGTVFGSVAPPLWMSRSGLFFQSTRIGQLAYNLFEGKEKSKKAWGGLEMFLDSLISSDDPALQRVYKNYASNLGDIIDSGKRAGANVLVSSVAVNLKDCPPFRSNSAKKLFLEEKFINARDEDSLRFRADSKINSLAAEVAMSKGVQFIDSEKMFSKNDFPGDELFVDHVHFTFKGSYFLARLFADQVVSTLKLEGSRKDWLSEEDCAKRLGLTPIHRIQILREMQQWFSKAPFRDQPNYQERDSKIVSEIARLNSIQSPQSLDEEEKNFESLLIDNSNDWQLRKEFAVHLAARKKYNESSIQYQRMAEIMPHRPEMWYRLGSSCQRRGNLYEAQKAFEKAIKIKPNFYQAHFQLALCFAEQKLWSESDEYFKSVVKYKPDFQMGWIRWGQMLDLSGESAEAIKKYESVFEIVPNSLSANKALAAHYFKAKEYKKSEKYFRATVKITPQDAESNLGLALSLIKQRKADEGVSVLRYVLEIDPNNSPAKRYLKQLGLSN